MKLLFNHNTKAGNEELKELIGHIDKDINFDNLKSDIITATTEIIKLVGQPIYDAATTAYEADSNTEADKDLIYKLRYPIALDGYRNYSKASDVVHSNNGRKIRVDEKNKVPFEWMLDRDNEILERKYYKAVDDLIDYLDANSNVWKASNAYKTSQKYFVRTTADFSEAFNIESRLLLIKLQPAFGQFERKHIIPRIGQTLFDALKTKLQNNTALSTDELNLVHLIKEACVYHALAWGMRVLRVTLFPEGVLQRYTSDRQSTKASKVSEKLETELAAQEFTNQAAELLQEIEKVITNTAATDVTEEILNEITSPTYKFDDCDDFVSM